MALYHLHVKNISRRDGRSAVAAAAYRAGETMPNEAEEKDSAFGGRHDVVFAEIKLPAETPAWMVDRAKLALEARDPEHVGQVLRTLTEEVRRGAGLREARLEDALPNWRELHASMVVRLRAAGYDTSHPLLDWPTVEKALRQFDADLICLRLDEAERPALEPVPDPEGRPIDPRTLEEAEDRLLSEQERETEISSTPRPEQMPADARERAQAAERQNALDVPDDRASDYRLAPHENRLDWLDDVRTEPSAFSHEQMEDRLDWLLPKKREREDTERDLDRERDR
ncbi:MobA/MobL family protein [Bradyrhizobium sp. LMG 9283]|uniref:MobA/MobL family protein n=1 Tax=Bradyrhizobium sp. LMG 9283 TaxID=592064 RepID=UPI00389047E5